MVTASASLLLGLATLAASPPATLPPRWGVARPRVEVWTNRGEDVAERGDRIRVFVRAEHDGFVTVFRVDTDGRVRVLFPREPWEDTFLRGDREYEVEGAGGRDAFSVDDYPGVGYVFAVVSADPFDYRGIVAGDHWDYRLIADGRVRGDPYVALTDLAQRIVAEGYEDWDYDLVPYYVERHYDYPRFACYDCHTYASWTYWDPYAYDCVRFRLVIYDDPWYYPYRYYGGTRVVWVRPYRPQPRYVFKDWGTVGRSRDRFITRVRQRPAGEARERTTPFTRSGVGAIPAPRTRDRTGPATGGADRTPLTQPDRPDRRDRSDRPDRQADRAERGVTGSSAVPTTPLGAPRTTGRDQPERAGGATERTLAPARGPERTERVTPDRGTTARERTERVTPDRGTPAREETRGTGSRAVRETPSGRADAPARGEARGQERRAEPREARPSTGSRESRGGGDRSARGSSSRGGGDRPAAGSSSRGGGSRTPELKRRKP